MQRHTFMPAQVLGKPSKPWVQVASTPDSPTYRGRERASAGKAAALTTGDRLLDPHYAQYPLKLWILGLQQTPGRPGYNKAGSHPRGTLLAFEQYAPTFPGVPDLLPMDKVPPCNPPPLLSWALVRLENRGSREILGAFLRLARPPFWPPAWVQFTPC